MKTIYHTAFALVLASAIVTSGCKKEKEVDYDTQSSQDNAQAEGILNDINEIADQAVEDGTVSTHRYGTGESSLLTGCATISRNIDSLTGAGSTTIDFGAYYCRGNDLRYRKGIITVSFNGGYKNPGTTISITATDYFAGYDSLYATKVNGHRTVINNGLNNAGHLNFSIEANATLVNYLSQQMTWHSSRNREWIAGDSTATWNDDEYLITGSADGTSFAAVNFTASIIEALHVKLSCRYITAGKFTLTPEGKPARTLDYGDGACDGAATVTIGDKVYEITLR